MRTSKINFNQIHNANCLKKCNREKRKESTDDGLCSMTTSVVDDLPIRCVGEWAMQKIFHLIQYYRIFAIGMKDKWDGNINYIEICSGPGRCINRYTGEEFNGTSLCILEHEACKYLNKLLFFDYNENVVETLNIRISQRNINNAKAIFGDYNEPSEMCTRILKETNGVGLNLIFIDPTDCSVPFTLLRTLKNNLKNVDFIVNFAIRTDVNRNIRDAILSPDNHQNVIRKYESFLGSHEFFSDQNVIKSAKNGDQMGLRKQFREEYMDRLRSIGYKHFDFKPIENYYDLVFASSHPKGIEFWEKANKIGFDGQRSLF